jgi:hypothetical protein
MLGRARRAADGACRSSRTRTRDRREDRALDRRQAMAILDWLARRARPVP